MSEGKWIRFEDGGTSTSGKTRKWWVVSKQQNLRLGWIEWFAQWKKYVFCPEFGTLYEQDCLRDIAKFIEERTKEHYAALNAAKAKPEPRAEQAGYAVGECFD